MNDKVSFDIQDLDSKYKKIVDVETDTIIYSEEMFFLDSDTLNGYKDIIKNRTSKMNQGMLNIMTGKFPKIFKYLLSKDLKDKCLLSFSEEFSDDQIIKCDNVEYKIEFKDKLSDWFYVLAQK